jgi:nicotinamide-nucleotide amidase
MKTANERDRFKTLSKLEATARDILVKACQQGLMIATAESCTGGLVASLLTDIEGASRAFERGFVVYTDEAKCELLDIEAELIARYGAVSAETAVAMVRGALRRSRADLVIAVTGFAGPAGPHDEPGLVYFACARRGQFLWCHQEHFGNIGRDAIRQRCLSVCLDMLQDANA